MVVNNITQKVGRLLKNSHVNLSELFRKTEIPYNTLYASVWDRSRHRDLRANELMSICVVLGINPMDFVDDPDKKDVV